MGRCLESVFTSGAAGNAEVEVIVVNDGTPDGSMAVVESYAAKHDNLIIINQENAGLSEARNAGLRIARGKYIWFIDSDDYVSSTAVTEMLKIADGHDEEDIVFDTWRVYEDGSKESRAWSLFQRPSSFKYYNQVHEGYFFYAKMCNGLVQRHLFLRSFLVENDLFFVPGIYHEDGEFTQHLFTCARTILPVREKYYYYVVRSTGSICSTFRMKRFEDKLWMLRSYVERGDKTKSWRVRTIYHDAASVRSYGLIHSEFCSRPEYAAFISEHRKELTRNVIRSYFLSIRKNNSMKTAYMIVTLFGISNIVHDLYHKLKGKGDEE